MYLSISNAQINSGRWYLVNNSSGFHTHLWIQVFASCLFGHRMLGWIATHVHQNMVLHTMFQIVQQWVRSVQWSVSTSGKLIFWLKMLDAAWCHLTLLESFQVLSSSVKWHWVTQCISYIEVHWVTWEWLEQLETISSTFKQYQAVSSIFNQKMSFHDATSGGQCMEWGQRQ